MASYVPAMPDPNYWKLLIFKGARYEEFFTFAEDLTGYTIKAVVKKNLSDTAAWFELTGSFYDPADKTKFKLYLAPTQTKAIDITGGRKGKFVLEIRLTADATERHELVRADAEVFERTAVD